MRSLIFLLLFSSQAFAALSIRDLDGDWSNGHEGVYDDVLDITWLADANYAETSGFAPVNDTLINYHLSSYNIQPDGRMGHNAAKNWALSLNLFGFDSWRLPSVGPDYPYEDPLYGHDQINSELGSLFYSSLGNTGNNTGTCSPLCFQNTDFVDPANDSSYSFENIPSSYIYFWYLENRSSNAYQAWVFDMQDGSQAGSYSSQNSFYVWPVHDGDIGASPVPLPAGIYLFVSGLVGLGVLKGKTKAS